jgi:hypothetical protein
VFSEDTDKCNTERDTFLTCAETIFPGLQLGGKKTQVAKSKAAVAPITKKVAALNKSAKSAKNVKDKRKYKNSPN